MSKNPKAPVEAAPEVLEAPKPKKAPTEYTLVKMDDGREVEFAGKRQLLKSSGISEDGVVTVRMDFRNGETRTFTIPDGLLLQFAAHGAEQKLGDETAGLSDIDDMILAIDTLTDRLNKGEWGVKREVSGLAGASVLAKALVEHTGKAAPVIREFLAGKSQAEKVALRNNPAIQPIIARLEAGKKKKEKTVVDTDALLGELA